MYHGIGMVYHGIDLVYRGIGLVYHGIGLVYHGVRLVQLWHLIKDAPCTLLVSPRSRVWKLCVIKTAQG